MEALLIEFDLERGERAGNINPRDAGLKCYGWQDLESRPAKEIRVIEDNRGLTQYEGIEGVTLLKNDDEIEATIEKEIPKRYAIVDEMLFQMSVAEKKIKMGRFSGKTRGEIAEELYKEDVLGLVVKTPLKLREIYKLK